MQLAAPALDRSALLLAAIHCCDPRRTFCDSSAAAAAAVVRFNALFINVLATKRCDDAAFQLWRPI